MPPNKIAVAYRIPMTITKVIVFPNGNAYPVCPHCNISLEREFQNYCDRCGQALNWKQYSNAVISYI